MANRVSKLAEPKAQMVRVRGAKDRPITIRFDSESRSKLNKLAAEQGLGPSTFARLILMSVIECREKLPKYLTYWQLCPLCNGVGQVSGGYFNRPGDHNTWAASKTMEKCQICDGKGIIRTPDMERKEA